MSAAWLSVWFGVGLALSAGCVVGAGAASAGIEWSGRWVRGLFPRGIAVRGVCFRARRLIFPARNRYRPGVLGNLLLRSGAMTMGDRRSEIGGRAR
jgi:hypothetical protein